MAQLIFDVRFTSLKVKNRDKFSVPFFPPSSSIYRSPSGYVFFLWSISLCSLSASLEDSLFIRCIYKKGRGKEGLLWLYWGRLLSVNQFLKTRRMFFIYHLCYSYCLCLDSRCFYISLYFLGKYEVVIAIVIVCSSIWCPVLILC